MSIMKKKVLFVINTLGTAGAEIALLSLLRALDPDEVDVDLFVVLGQGELRSELPEYVNLLNTNYDDTAIHSKAGHKATMRLVRRAFFSNGALWKNWGDIASCLFSMVKAGHIWPDKLLWRTVSDGVQRIDKEYDLAVAFLEGASTFYVSDHVKAKRKATFVHIDYTKAGYTRKIDHNCYLGFDRVFTVSDEVREHFLEVYPELSDKTAVFHNIVNKDSCWINAANGIGFEDDFDGIRILTVGRLTYQKGYDVAIDAMKLVKDAGIKARWYVVGEGELRPELEKQAAGYGLMNEFVLLGAKKNPFAYYLQADIYVQPSRFEGKSIAIQEAQTLACAIVASDVSGNREQIVNEQDGLLCQYTSQKLAEAIIRLAKDASLRDRLAEGAGEKGFDVSTQMQLFSELLV